MTARKARTAPAPEPEPAQAPPFWIADVPLPVSTEMGGDGIARAFNPGDPVPLDHVERYGWQQFVHAPSGDWPPPEPAAPEAPADEQSGKAGPDKE